MEDSSVRELIHHSSFCSHLYPSFQQTNSKFKLSSLLPPATTTTTTISNNHQKQWQHRGGIQPTKGKVLCCLWQSKHLQLFNYFVSNQNKSRFCFCHHCLLASEIPIQLHHTCNLINMHLLDLFWSEIVTQNIYFPLEKKKILIFFWFPLSLILFVGQWTKMVGFSFNMSICQNMTCSVTFLPWNNVYRSVETWISICYLYIHVR